jgi:hypothetical protein
MFRNCISCGQPTIVARMVDGAIAAMDSEPATDGAAPLLGDLHDQPTVIFGIESEADAAFWQVPFDADRYDRHECKPVAS